MPLILTGASELQRKLRDQLPKHAKAAMRRGCRAAAKMIAAAEKAIIPEVTGQTGQSVKVRAIKRSRVRLGVRVEVQARDPQGRPYAAGPELGTHRIQPKHWERQAVEQTGDAALNRCGEVATAALEKLAAK